MKRSEVYQLIDGERTYQESLWPVNPLAEGEFIALLQDYVTQARTIWVREPKPCQETMAIIRKIAAIAVNALEQHGAPARELPVVEPETTEPAKIDAGMMEAAITGYYKAYGLAAAKQLLTKYGVERVTQIAPEHQAEAYAELTA